MMVVIPEGAEKNTGVAPPRELLQNEKQLHWIDPLGNHMIDLVVMSGLMNDDYNYMRACYGDAPVGDDKTESYSPRIEEVVEESRKILYDNPEMVIINEKSRYLQLQVLMFDVLVAFKKIFTKWREMGSMAWVQHADVLPMLQMLKMQYEMRTNKQIEINSSYETLDGETETARQIRIAYIRMLSMP